MPSETHVQGSRKRFLTKVKNSYIPANKSLIYVLDNVTIIVIKCF